MARLKDIVVDCRHAASLARFWAAAMDGYAVAPYDEQEMDHLRRQGISDPEDDPTVLVQPDQPGWPRLFFQSVPESKQTKNRLHLDLVADDRAAELDRLVALGATEVERHGDWIVLGDPEGNEFCLFRPESVQT